MSDPVARALLDAERPATIEPWLDKRQLAEHLACSVRSVELAAAEGMPRAILFGRVKFKASEAEAWLEQTGRLERRGSINATDKQRPDDE